MQYDVTEPDIEVTGHLEVGVAPVARLVYVMPGFVGLGVTSSDCRDVQTRWQELGAANSHLCVAPAQRGGALNLGLP